MESQRPQLVLLADPPDAFCTLFGISLLERLLRVVQRLGFREATILSDSPEQLEADLAKPSWARADVALTFRARNSGGVRVDEVAAGAGRVLVVSAGFYYDARLLKAMSEQDATTLLVDSAPPPDCARLWSEGRASAGRGGAGAESQDNVSLGLAAASPSGVNVAAVLLERDWLVRHDPGALLMDQLSSDAAAHRVESCDAARQPTYVSGLRKDLRPVFFPAPSPDLVPVAGTFLRDAAQNGVLDFPGLLHAPLEDWIVAHLSRTSIRPNQITFITMLLGIVVTLLFATGHLWFGVALALAIGVLDGVDGKLARTKVETTSLGDWEHVTDYFIELSWWTAMAYHFQTGKLPHAYELLILLVASDILDRLAKRGVKKKIGRNLDDVSNFDRFVRCIGGRRNINIWIFTAALFLGDAVNGFVLFCWWSAATAAAHVVRAFQIRFGRPVAIQKS